MVSCHLCGARPVDPVRGPSPWKRGVRGDEQVLVCPACQGGRDWTAGLDRCGGCRSVRLVRVLGGTRCRDCGWERDPAAPAPGPGGPAGPAAPAGTAGPGRPGGQRAPAPRLASGPRVDRGGLSAEVGAALDRRFGRSGG